MTMSRQWRAPGVSRTWLLAFGCCLSLALLCVSGGAQAQEEEAPNVFEGAEKSDAPETVKKSDAPETVEELGGMRPEDAIRSSAELVEQANAAMRDLSRVSSETKLAPELEALAREMPKRRAELAARIAVAKDSTRRSRRGVWVRDIRFSFAESSEQIELWHAQVNEMSTALTSARRRTTEILAFWRRARDLAREAKVAAEVRRQTQLVVEAGQRAELALARPESVIVPLQTTLVEMREMTTAFLAYAEREGPNLVLDARQQDFPIWKAVRDVRTLVGKADTQDIIALKGPFADVRKTAHHMLQMGKLFWSTNTEELVRPRRARVPHPARHARPEVARRGLARRRAGRASRPSGGRASRRGHATPGHGREPCPLRCGADHRHPGAVRRRAGLRTEGVSASAGSSLDAHRLRAVRVHGARRLAALLASSSSRWNASC